MTKIAKFRALSWLLLLFMSGAVLGNVFTPHRSAPTDWWRRSGAEGGMPPESSWVQYRFRNISERFDLTPEQQQALLPAFEEAESGLREVREQASRRTRRIVADNNRAIHEVMTPEQVEAFEAWREDLRARRQAGQNP